VRIIHRLIVTALCTATIDVAMLAQDRWAVRSPNGISFSEFKGFGSWQVIAPSQPDDAGGCGVAKDGCIKAILGNAAMIKAYEGAGPTSDHTVPDGAMIAKVEWHRQHVAAPPYGVGVPGALAGVSVMVKDSKRFPQTNGWGYATFVRTGESDTFKASTDDPAVMKALCHSCHTRGAKAHDFVFTRYAAR
jgi:hypothetical protein